MSNSSCNKIEVDANDFEEGSPGFWTYTGKKKCSNCGRTFHGPSIKAIQTMSGAAAAIIFGGTWS